MHVTTVGMSYEVAEGSELAFEARFALVVKAMQQQPEHLDTTVYRQLGEGRKFLAVSVWKSREGFDVFVRSESFRASTRWLHENVLVGRARHEVYGAPATGHAA